MDINKWKDKNKKGKKYAHFDNKVSLVDVWSYISKPSNIVHHGFYPFIHYEKKFNKYRFNKKVGKGEHIEKSRELCYSAHIDGYIYSYYGYLLNQIYNKYVQDHGLNDVALAYRDNLHKNNIHFAKMAFDFIKKDKKCCIVIGDFTHFFDNLDHKYLKEKLCELLGVNNLPDDYYAIFKNITKYSKWELEDLLAINKLENNEEGIKKLNSMDRVLTIDQFNRLKKENQYRAKKNKGSYGIPQGSAISAVLSNIYMIDADYKINKYVKSNNGLYMRYCDDFIIVLPLSNAESFEFKYKNIKTIFDCIPRVVLSPEKTQLFYYDNGDLKNCNALILKDIPNGKNIINYLGFSFNGKDVTIRDKTISKYYYRMYRKLNTIVKNNGYTKNGNKISCQNLYDKYSYKGAKKVSLTGERKKMKGNFISYVKRAKGIFKDEPVEMKTKRHMIKIRRKLDKIPK